MKNILEYKGYHAKVELDAEDGIFVGTVIGIVDSLNFHATNIEDLKNNFQICIDDYLQMCEMYQKTPDKEYKGSFNIRIPSELHKEIDVLAESQGISLNQYVINALNESLIQTPKKETVYVVPVPVQPQKNILKNMNSDYRISENFISTFKNETNTMEVCVSQ